LYSGGTTYQTIIDGGVGTVNGEWMQISSNTPVSLSSFAFGSPHGVTDTYSGRIPGQFYIVGSNSWSGTAQSWTPIAYCVFTGNPYINNTANNYTYTYNIPIGTVTSQVLSGNMTITTYGNSASTFTYYRFVATALLGTTGSVSYANGLMIGEWVLNCVNPAATTPGYTVSNWLSDLGANTGYTYVSKWYDQGMDASFNCATQYTLGVQPTYDVTKKLINSGYTGALQTKAFFILPNGAYPYLDSSYSFVTRLGNNTSAQYEMIMGGGGNTAGVLYWAVGSNSTVNAYANGKDTGFNAITYAANSPYSIVYDNANSTASRALTLYYQGNSIYTVNGAGGLSAGTRPNTYNYIFSGDAVSNTVAFDPLNGEMYNFFVFSSAISNSDRLLLESTSVG
jgi:hypothetical protein